MNQNVITILQLTLSVILWFYIRYIKNLPNTKYLQRDRELRKQIEELQRDIRRLERHTGLAIGPDN